MGATPPTPRMANDERDAQTGTFETKYTDADFFEALDALDETGTKEVAEHIGCARETARSRLYGLAENGAVDRREVGSVALWTLAESENDQ